MEIDPEDCAVAWMTQSAAPKKRLAREQAAVTSASLDYSND
jgi:hypothetical protein